MGHYDEHYEAEADESRRLNKLRKDLEYSKQVLDIVSSDLSSEEKVSVLAVAKAKYLGVMK